MNEAILRNLLREGISEEYTLVEIGEFEDILDSYLRPIPHRDIYRKRYESRLAGLQRAVSDRTDLHDEHRAVLTALSTIPDDERLYFWEVRASSREYSGIACTHGIVAFYGAYLSTNDPDA